MTRVESVLQKVKSVNINSFKIYYLGAAGISSFEKINEEELKAILNDCDPIGKTSI